MEENTSTATESELKLVISTDTAPGAGLPAEIAFNYDELKAKLTAHVSKYDGLVVQDNDIAGARKIRAEINGMIGQLKTAGSSVKENWNKPLDTFLSRVKELINIAKPIEVKIGDQIKEYDARKREEKRKEVEAVLLELVNEAVKDDNDEEMATIFINSDHWHGCVKSEMLAQSASMTRTRKTLEAEVKRCREQVENARRIYGNRADGDVWRSKAYYALARWDYDANTAFNDVDRQIAEAERIAKRRAEKEQAEREAKERLAAKRAAAQGGQGAPVPVVKPTAPVAATSPAPEQPAPAPVTAPAAETPTPEPVKPAPAPEAQDTMSYTLKITGPREKLFALRDWLDANGLTYEKL